MYKFVLHHQCNSMKKSVLIFVLVICFSARLKAQQVIQSADIKTHIGKVGTLCDSVYSVKIFSDTLTLINMGGNYPNQKFTVAVKGNKVVLDWANLKNKHICVTGLLELYKNAVQIVASEPNQIVVSK
jgi:hypothetical protein